MRFDLWPEFINWLKDVEGKNDLPACEERGLKSDAPQSAKDAYKKYCDEIREFNEENERRIERGERPIIID
jgi:hypothetical protein